MQTKNINNAQYLLRELPYDSWFTIGILHAPKGVSRADIGSLEELLWNTKPSIKSLSAVKHDALEKWLRESVKDIVMADTVRAIIDQDLSYIETCKLVYEATEARVNELKASIGEEDHDETVA